MRKGESAREYAGPCTRQRTYSRKEVQLGAWEEVSMAPNQDEAKNLPKNENKKEPWLRGTLTYVPAVPRAVLHALELAAEDIEKWCGGLSDDQINARPVGIAPVAFHLRHIARSLDRLLTYAEGYPLTDDQIAAMKTELVPDARRDAIFAELHAAFAKSAARVRARDGVYAA